MAKGIEQAHPRIADALDAHYRAALMSFFLRRVGCRAEAEDLTQETFARLLASVETSRLDNVGAFVFTIATNLLRDRGRRSRVRGQEISISPSDQSDQVPPELVEEIAPERVLLGREDLAQVLKALDMLGERTRDIFILARLERMKVREIAALFGMPASTVEKHLMRATLHLARTCGRS